MRDYRIDHSAAVWPTPAGAFYAVQSASRDGSRDFLLQLLAGGESRPLADCDLSLLSGHDEDAARQLFHLQNLAYLQAVNDKVAVPQGPLEDVLPPLLAQLSGSGKAVLADEQGFYLSLAGFPHESAEELSALSGSLLTVHDRHRRLLNNNLGLRSAAWGLVDEAGNSEIGFWPIVLPRNRFTLILAGMPLFNCPGFTAFVSCLAMRYHR